MAKLSNKGIDYDIKVLLAWGESISGNQKITGWLTKNGYPELGLFFYALRNEPRSREWLMENGHPHLLALINGIEGNEEARSWLEKHGYDLLHTMALSGDGENEAHEKLLKADLEVFAMLAKKMEAIKDGIDLNKADFHRFYSS